MPKVLLADPVPAPLVQRMRPLLPPGIDFDVVPTSEDADFAARAVDAADRAFPLPDLARQRGAEVHRFTPAR